MSESAVTFPVSRALPLDRVLITALPLPIDRNFYADQLILLPTLSDFDQLIQFVSLLNRLATEPFINLCAVDYHNRIDHTESWRMDRIFAFVKDHYQQDVHLSDVASVSAMNKEAFCRHFKKATNKSFFAFLNEYRINLACKELIETDLSVGEIAFRCGFNSGGFFHKQFDKFKQMPPTAYRKAHRIIPIVA